MKARRKHYLRANESSRRPTHLIFLDVSTEVDTNERGDERHTFKAADVISWRRSYSERKREEDRRRFSTSRDLLWWLITRVRANSRTIVVSMNPVRDLAVTDAFQELPRQGWAMGTPVSNSRLGIIPFRRERRTLTFVAHKNLFPFAPLSGAFLGGRLSELKTTWLEHLDMLDERDLGDFHLTIGAQALAIYRHRFMHHPILLHAHPDAMALERRATYGALYQPFFVGVAPPDNYYYLDTNSMYPWCMATFTCPWRLRGYVGRLPLETLGCKLDKYLVVADVRVRTETPRYPAHWSGRTVFPVGEFTTTLTTPDLWEAVDRGHLVDCFGAAWYDGEHLFEEYVNELWRWRKEYQDAGEVLRERQVKAWMVSLYGKFGAWRYKHESQGEWDPGDNGSGVWVDLDSGEESQWFALGGQMWTSRKDGETNSSFPAIMAHVAAYGRRRMFELIDDAGPGNVFVALSDGLIVNQAGFDALKNEINPYWLGALKRKRYSKYLEIRSDTEFILGGRRWMSGVKEGGIEIDDGVFIVNLDPALGLHAETGEPGAYTRLRRKIELKRQIRTGIPQPDGWIAPLRLA